MKNVRSWGSSAVAALLLAACGGGGDGDQAPRVHYSALVSFGDSLSDVGTYATTNLKAATGGLGGKYTINSTAGKNWTELLAAQIGVAAPCPAQTGLMSSGPLAAFAEPVANHAGCTNFAQGGARVTDPVGVSNAATVAAGDPSGYLGQLTVPVVTQINNYLATQPGGVFSGSELVTVLAGANDLFMNLAAVSAGADPTAAVTAMGTAGAELAVYVKSLIVAKGATHVVVVNVPDVTQTPFGYSVDAQTQGLINAMVTTFNQQLAAGLAGTTGVLVVDAYTQGRAQTASPLQYGVTNVTTPACDLAALGATLFASSLVCTSSTLITGDVSHYQFADTVHPTPYGYQLLAQYVTAQLAIAGWL